MGLLTNMEVDLQWTYLQTWRMPCSGSTYMDDAMQWTYLQTWRMPCSGSTYIEDAMQWTYLHGGCPESVCPKTCRHIARRMMNG